MVGSIYRIKDAKNPLEKNKKIVYNIMKEGQSALLSPFLLYFINTLLLRYFLRVASPPRTWRSDLLRFSTFFTSANRFGLRYLSFPVRSLCTVLLLMPKCFAALLTVALFSTTYSPIIMHLSFSLNLIT